jgi:protein arginine kinase
VGDGETEEDSLGDMYIIDNQFSIGKTEEALIIQLESITNLIAGYERETRNIIISGDRINMEDEVFRAKGILENCRKITLTEAIRHLSSLKLGKYYNLIDENITYGKINCLLLQIQKSHIIKNNIQNSDEDKVRAEFIQSNLFDKD